MRRQVWIDTIIPLFIIFSLWLDGWLFPLILLPILYVLLVEKKGLGLFGVSKNGLSHSIIIGLGIAFFLSALYYPIFLYYLSNIVEKDTIGVYGVCLDIVWYPIYEEISYRSFTLIHFADFRKSILNKRNVIVNLLQSSLFLTVHKNHFGTPLVLVPVFMLGLLNGFLFLKKKNICGCIISHSVLNGIAILIRCLQIG